MVAGPVGSVGAVEVAAGDRRETCSVIHAAELVGVSRRTIYNWMTAGKVQFVRTASGNPRIIIESLWREGSVARPVDTVLRTALTGGDER